VLATVMERRAIFCDERLLSFAWAPWRSEGWFDLHVETLPGFRRQGLARRAVAALINFERTEGRTPVWGATDEITLALGRSLAFVDCGQTLWRAGRKSP
jgi:GNAT superfamily N-acetyltransferase